MTHAAYVFSKMGHNFMTPEKIEYRDVEGTSPWESAGKVVELSRGTGMDNKTIYGVTVRSWDGETDPDDESKLLHDQTEAASYFQGIKP
jgi:hypothetical protein